MRLGDVGGQEDRADVQACTLRVGLPRRTEQTIKLPTSLRLQSPRCGKAFKQKGDEPIS